LRGGGGGDAGKVCGVWIISLLQGSLSGDEGFAGIVSDAGEAGGAKGSEEGLFGRFCAGTLPAIEPPGGRVSEGTSHPSEETLVFAKRMGYHKLGLAFCIGLKREASTIARIMARRGFEVVGACCKVGGMPKEEMGLREEEKLHPFHFEACCNPIAQAKILNGEGTDLNVLVGLCVGHDTLFMRFSLAPVTCLIAKDRVLGHNPAAAVYTSESYYRERLWSDED
jgi:uncharacterized metal-binding protein